MPRLTATFVLSLCLLGCQSVIFPWDRVELQTVSADTPRGCVLIPAFGKIIVDPNSGTPVIDWGSGVITPITWPFGYTARRVGPEVLVSDASGTVVATTGRWYDIWYPVVGREVQPGQPWVTCGVSSRPT
jgi:hypothetical protein